MNKKLKKQLIIIVSVGIAFVSLGYLSYKIYFEKLYLFKDNEKAFLNSVIEYYDINKTFIPKPNEYKTISLQQMYNNQLIEALKIPKSSKFCDEKNSFVRAINDNGKIKFVTYLKCGKFKSKVDHESPKIILNGDKKVIVNLFDKYTDSGIKTVVDNEDGVINNNKVEILGSVDTSKPGNYKLTYKVSDKNFNITRETRTVVVADNLNNIIKRDTNNINYYKGKENNNYILFSGMLFRIVKINDDNTVKIVTDNNISHLSYTEDEYQDSNLRNWLNNYFYNHINKNSKKYIEKSNWCTDQITDYNNFTCNNKIKDNIGLLNIKEYTDSIENELSYLDGVYKKTLLLNKYDNNNNYLTFGINKIESIEEQNSYASIRPALNLKANTYIISGKGTKEEPYMIGDYSQGESNQLLNKRLIGEYVKYSGHLAIISGITKDKNIMLSFVDELFIKNKVDANEKKFFEINKNFNFNDKEENNIGYLLNNIYIDNLLNTYLVKDKFDIPIYESNKKYNELEKKEFNNKIFMPYSSMIFSSDVYHEGNIIFKYIYSDILNDNQIMENDGHTQVSSLIEIKEGTSYSIKPVVFITKNAKIRRGNGTINNPYIIK